MIYQGMSASINPYAKRMWLFAVFDLYALIGAWCIGSIPRGEKK